MKKIIWVLFTLFVYSASAQIAFNTGSVQLDADLNSINARGIADFGSYKGDLSICYGVSEKKIEYLAGSLNMAPGEIYLALEISKLSHNSVDQLIAIYDKNKHKGWGQVAKEAGIKPGSTEFHQLKGNASSHKKNDMPKGNGKSQGKSQGKAKGKP